MTFKNLMNEEIIQEGMGNYIYDMIISLDINNTKKVAEIVLKSKTDEELLEIYKGLVKVSKPTQQIKVYISMIFSKIEPLIKVSIIEDNIASLKKDKQIKNIYSKCDAGYNDDCHQYVVELNDAISSDSTEYKKLSNLIIKKLGDSFTVGIFNSGPNGITGLIIK